MWIDFVWVSEMRNLKGTSSVREFNLQKSSNENCRDFRTGVANLRPNLGLKFSDLAKPGVANLRPKKKFLRPKLESKISDFSTF